jgi:hypothetical protein
MSAKGDHRKLLRQCEEKGCTIEHVASGYIKVWLPGKRAFVRISATPSSQNWLNRAKSDLRKKGLSL